MKIVVSKSELVALIGKIQNIISVKPAIPILSNVLIEAFDDQLILSGTDLTTSIKCFLEAKIIEEGAIALPARKFFQLIRELTSPQIKISNLGNDIAEIISGSSIFKINGMNKKEFPKMPESSGNAQISIDSNLLKELLSKSSFSASRDDNRHVLNGVYLKIENKKANFIGTDGKRISKISAQIDIDPSFQGSYIIPIKAAEEMIKILEEQSNRAMLFLTSDKIFLENNNMIIATKLLTGTYPDVEKVIPKKIDLSIPVHREELISLLKQVALFTTEKCNSVKFILSPGKLDILINSSEVGEGNVNMAVDYQKEKIDIAFNPNLFLDILRHSKDETVNLSITDSYDPGVITDSSSAIFVIMPMRLVKKEKVDDYKEPAFT